MVNNPNRDRESLCALTGTGMLVSGYIEVASEISLYQEGWWVAATFIFLKLKNTSSRSGSQICHVHFTYRLACDPMKCRGSGMSPHAGGNP